MSEQRISELRNAIEQSRGATATIWEYVASLSQLTIRISLPGSAENIHFVCNACIRIEMFTAWGDVNLAMQD